MKCVLVEMWKAHLERKLQEVEVCSERSLPEGFALIQGMVARIARNQWSTWSECALFPIPWIRPPKTMDVR